LGEKDVSMANPDDVKKITGFTIGGVSPVGHLKNVNIYVDEGLKRFNNIYAAAGHPNAIFKISFNQIIELTNGEISELSE
jgi:prolyl-tRNA editing enzyme YbaK/EbsC (Cys-tRNA(Pro) deacylase)